LKTKTLRLSKIRDWFPKRKKQVKAEKKKLKPPEPEWMKYLTFGITLVSMLLGLSILPLFPQPLPTVLAFLIAFVTLKKPVFGMPIGGLLIGLGLMYNLAEFNFIAMLGSTEMRRLVVVLFLFLFTALPIIFRDRRSAIAINLGIIAAISLFSTQTFFLAIPIIVSSIVLFKKNSILSITYYVLLTVPLLLMQYLNHVIQIPRIDWWVEAGSSPPVFVPLTQIFTDVQDSMLQFRLYDTSKVVFAISEQLTLEPPIMEHTITEMLSHYLDSIPGIIFLIVMIIGIVSAIVLFLRKTSSQTNISEIEKFFPIIIGIAATLLFFVLANSLQDPLAFRVDLTGSAIILGTFAAFIFTIPVFFMDQTPKERATVDVIEKKCKSLLEKIVNFEEALTSAKNALPISFSPLEARLIISKDKVEDINNKNSKHLLPDSEINEFLTELNKVEKIIEDLVIELDKQLFEYQIFINCEYSKWKGQFENIGIIVKNHPFRKFERNTTLENRIESIKELIENNRAIAQEIIEITEKIYYGIRSLYDPNLPKESQSIIFSRKQLEEKGTPWNALETLYVSLTNMKRNYKLQISTSIINLEKSFEIINNFGKKNEKLSIALDKDYIKLVDLINQVKDFEFNMEKETFSIKDVIEIWKAFDFCIKTTKEIFTILFENIKIKERNIENMMPPEGYMWGKNLEIVEEMSSALKQFKRITKQKSCKILKELPKFLSLAENGKEIIIDYSQKEELLLNYPIAEIAVEEQLKKKKKVTANDLPFDPKYSLEYLKLYHSKRYHESDFDKINNILSSKK